MRSTFAFVLLFQSKLFQSIDYQLIQVFIVYTSARSNTKPNVRKYFIYLDESKAFESSNNIRI